MPDEAHIPVLRKMNEDASLFVDAVHRLTNGLDQDVAGCTDPKKKEELITRINELSETLTDLCSEYLFDIEEFLSDLSYDHVLEKQQTEAFSKWLRETTKPRWELRGQRKKKRRRRPRSWPEPEPEQ